MLTLYRLAELIGSPALVADGRSPVSTAVVDLAIRRVLADAPGSFAAVAEHPSTVVALRDLHRELRLAGPDAVAALTASSPRGREAARISQLTTRRLRADWYDEGDLLEHAELATGHGVPRTARPHDRVPPAATARTRNCACSARSAQVADVHVILGVTGDEAADAELAHDRGSAPARLVGARAVCRHHATGAAVRRRGDLHHRRRRRGPARRPGGARRRPRRHAVRADGRAVVGGATVRTTRRAPPRRRRDRVERPARNASGRTPRAATRASTCSTSTGVGCAAATCSTSSPTCPPAAPTVTAPHRGLGARQPRRRRCPRRPLDDRAWAPTPRANGAARTPRSNAAARNAADAEGLATFVTGSAVDARSPGRHPRPGSEWADLVRRADRAVDRAPRPPAARRRRACRARAGRTCPRPAPPPRRHRSAGAPSRVPRDVSRRARGGATTPGPHRCRASPPARSPVPPASTSTSSSSSERPTGCSHRRRSSDPLVSDSDRAAAGLTTSDVTAARVHRQFLSALSVARRGRDHVPARRSARHRHPCAVALDRGRRAVRSAARRRIARRRAARHGVPDVVVEHRLRGLSMRVAGR